MDAEIANRRRKPRDELWWRVMRVIDVPPFRIDENWAHRVEGLRANAFSAGQATLKSARDRTATCAIVPAVLQHARLLTVAFEPTISQLTTRPGCWSLEAAPPRG